MLAKLLNASKQERKLLPRYYVQVHAMSSGYFNLQRQIDSVTTCELHGTGDYHLIEAGDRIALGEWFGSENVYNPETDETKTGKYYMPNNDVSVAIDENTLLIYWQAGKIANENGSYYRQSGKYRYIVSEIPKKLKDDILAGAKPDYWGSVVTAGMDYVDQMYTPNDYYAPVTECKWGELPFPTATAGYSSSGGSFLTATVGDTVTRTIKIYATDVEDAKKYAIITSSNPDAVTINDDMTLAIHNAGSSIISVEWPQMNGKYVPYKASWTVEVAASISWEVENGNLNKAILNEDEANRYVKLNGLSEENKSRLIYESSNPSIATIDDAGKITLVSAGSVTITATLPANDDYTKELTKSFTLTIAELKFSHSENKTFDDESAPYEWYDGNWTGYDLGIICDERVPEGKMIQSNGYMIPSMSLEDSALLFFDGTDETGKDAELNMYSDGLTDGGLTIYLADGTSLKNDVSDGKKYPVYFVCSMSQNNGSVMMGMLRFIYIMNPVDAERYIKKRWFDDGLVWSTTDTPVQQNIKINFDNITDLESRFK